MALTACRECDAMISDAARVCPKCGAPVPRAPGERMKDLLLAVFIIAVVIAAGWVLIDRTVGMSAAKRMFASVFHTKVTLEEETVTVPKDEYRGVLVAVPYEGRVTLEVEALGGHSVDVHVMDGAQLLRLANVKPPFKALEIRDYEDFRTTAAPNATRKGRLIEASYIVVLEHSKPSTPDSDVRVNVRLEP